MTVDVELSPRPDLRLQLPLVCERAHQRAAPRPRRTIHKLSGKARKVGDVTYRETTDGHWLKGTEAGAALVPTEWPKAANDGEKWIDISIENQVLVAWQGKTPL